MNSSGMSRVRHALAAMLLLSMLTATVIALPAAITQVPLLVGGFLPLPPRRE